VECVKPVRFVVNTPTPAPLLVVLFKVVGFVTVLYATPLAVTEEIPGLTTFPPVIALFSVIFDIGVVVTEGKHPFQLGTPLQNVKT
jgi:hypothetical protein